jgi:hypothetical protein
MTAALIRLVHVGARELGLDDDTRRELQVATTGKASLTAMNAPELRRVIDALKARGFKVNAPRGSGRPAAQRADIRYAHVLWRLLHEAGAVRVAGPTGLNAFIRARFEKSWGAVPIDIDAMREWSEIRDVIDALHAMCGRAGIKIEDKGGRG